MWKDTIKEKCKDFIYITELPELKKLQIDLKEDVELAFDTETYVLDKWVGIVEKALDPFTSRVALIILQGRNSLPYCIDVIELNKVWSEEDIQEFFSFLKSKEKLMAYNAKFDLKMIRATFGVILENFWDILIMVKLLTNATGSKFSNKCGASLEDVCRDYLNVKISGKGKEQISRWAVRPYSNEESAIKTWVDKLKYGSCDTKYLFELNDKLLPVLTNPLPKTVFYKNGVRGLKREDYGLNMGEVLKLEQQSIVPIAEMEWNGLPIAKKAAEKFYNNVWNSKSSQNELNRVGGELCKLLSLDYNLCSPIDSNYQIPIKHSVLRNPVNLKAKISKATDLDLDNVQKSQISRLLDIFQELEKYKEAQESDTETQEISWSSEEEYERWQELEDLARGDLKEYSKLFSLILKYKELDKVNGMSLLSYINPETGRIHCNFSQLGASTSRLSSCIAEGQRVLIPRCERIDYFRIEYISPGEYVYCFTDEGKLTISKVNQVFNNGIKDVVKVKWQEVGKYSKTGSLICTPDHLIKTKYNGWVRAGNLKRFDITYSNHQISSVKPTGKSRVFDLEVEGYHNYIAEDLVVHNCTPNIQQISGRTEVISYLNSEQPLDQPD